MATNGAKKRRPESEPSLDLIPAKRPKVDSEDAGGALIKLPQNRDADRTSDLAAPNLLLTGHQADVLSTKFSHGGEHLVSSSRDKTILLWNVFGECQSYLLLKGHKNAVVQALWSHDDSQIVSGSSDTTLGVWDATSGKRLLKLAEHESFINAISLGQKDVHRIASVGDDSVSYLWDDRLKKSAQMIQQRYPLTSVALLDERNLLFTGGIDNIISAWDIRKTSAPAWTLKGHSETISSLCVDPEGSFLLSSSMDNTLRIWDVRAFAPDQRCIRIIGGVTHGIDKALIRCNWSSDGGLVASGSSDKNVYIFDSLSGSIKYCLPGHTGTVTEVDFHPKQPIVASASADKRIFLGELQEA